jgi:serine phosphatase RsbU (regulator of sigma subunit)
MIADLSAKGPLGSQLAQRLSNAFHIACSAFPLPSQILNQLNRFLCATFAAAETGHFATAFVCRFSAADAYCIYSSAGAEPPILCKDTRFYQTLPPPPGLVLGVEKDSSYSDFVMPIAENDTIVAFTDGFSESIRMDDRDRLGSHGVMEAMISALDRNSRLEICGLLAEIDRLNGSAYHDDATMVVASVRPLEVAC